MTAPSPPLATGFGRFPSFFCWPSARSPHHLLTPPIAKSITASPSRGRVICNSSSGDRTPTSGSGDNDSKVVLDAFFLGKAFAEAVNERIESTVGEILSMVGQWQAEQQKEVQDFQEEVLERAKKAKEKAALEVMGINSVPSKPLGSSSITSTNVTESPDPLEEILNE
ncbi:uncharacterized protein At4g13200, chloroplastic-like [Zingiber officinale]|uniref:Uncharacterized protein n=1 Tax=Zingiber officinale TaxID=94328 RepID=A0A8J5FKM1_ZINOF|nr:uncharacterized protein At4g13200, chloroplastic-like [Zingiber officinale]KAG6490207.1 hypothetical protein ZIOFF_051492 [Zingiber officinale]